MTASSNDTGSSIRQTLAQRLTVKVNDVPPMGIDFDERFDAEETAAALDDLGQWQANAFGFTLQIMPGSAHLTLRGVIRATVKHECVRCLRPVQIEIDVGADLRLMDAGAEDDAPDSTLERWAISGDGPPLDDDDDFVAYRGGRINVLDIAREQLVLELPAHPICEGEAAESCQLDAPPVDEAARVDPRWAALAELRQQIDEEPEA